ncbi:MAG: amidohydrolase family protein, partial [Clostridia bacterium]|nr:amidohydrolase family protein [Clostridia bacterium]
MNTDKRKNTITLPGFVDVHVHFREPGFSYKGTVLSERLAAIDGGYSAVCTMPNLRPVPDSVEKLTPQLELIEQAEQEIFARTKRRLRVFPYGALTVDEAGEKLADLEALSPYVIAFSDDGRGVQSKELMREAMRRAAGLGKLIAAHCEDDSLLRGG